MKYKHDYMNAISWARGHKDELEHRLLNSDDEKEIRRLIRVQMNFIDEVIPLLEQAETKAFEDGY